MMPKGQKSEGGLSTWVLCAVIKNNLLDFFIDFEYFQ